MGRKIFLILIFALQLANSKAEVDLSNGNFYFSCTDYLNQNSQILKIERVYNSKSGFHGIFGFGWSSNLETYLKVSVTGEILIHEYGGGSSSYFINKGDAESYKSNLHQNARLTAELMSQLSFSNLGVEDLFESYLKDRTTLEKDYELLEKNNQIHISLPETGKIFYNEGHGFEYVVKTLSGYVRYAKNGEKEFFTNSGQLIQRQNNDAFIHITYNDRNEISQVDDSQNTSLLFIYNSFRQVEKILSEGNLVCEYHYEQIGNLFVLIDNKDSDGDIFSYSYNTAGLITKVVNATTTIFLVTYSSNTNLPIKVIDGNSRYEFEFGLQQGTILTTNGTSRMFDANGDVRHIVVKEFFFEINKYNHPVKVKEISTEDGVETTTTESFKADGNGFFDSVITSKKSGSGGRSILRIRVRHQGSEE